MANEYILHTPQICGTRATLSEIQSVFLQPPQPTGPLCRTVKTQDNTFWEFEVFCSGGQSAEEAAEYTDCISAEG